MSYAQKKKNSKIFNEKYSHEQFVRILSHYSGSKNLQALCSLLVPVVNSSGYWQYVDEVVLTPLYQLTRAGFGAVDVMGVVSHNSGSKNL